MQAIVKLDPGKGKVYTDHYRTLEAARRLVRSPYYRDCRIVIIPAAGAVECYERGAGSLRDRRVS